MNTAAAPVNSNVSFARSAARTSVLKAAAHLLAEVARAVHREGSTKIDDAVATDAAELAFVSALDAAIDGCAPTAVAVRPGYAVVSPPTAPTPKPMAYMSWYEGRPHANAALVWTRMTDSDVPLFAESGLLAPLPARKDWVGDSARYSEGWNACLDAIVRTRAAELVDERAHDDHVA